MKGTKEGMQRLDSVKVITKERHVECPDRVIARPGTRSGRKDLIVLLSYCRVYDTIYSVHVHLPSCR
jgi:hypothetical protein